MEHNVQQLAGVLQAVARSVGIDDLAGTAARVAQELSGADIARLLLAERLGGEERQASSWPGDWPLGELAQVPVASLPLPAYGAFAGGKLELISVAQSFRVSEKIALMSALAMYVAAAFDGFYRRAREELTLPAMETEPEWPINADQLFSRLVRRMLHLCHAECGSLFLVDPDLDRPTMNVCVQGSAAEQMHPATERCMLCWPSKGAIVSRSANQPPALIGEIGKERRYAVRTRTVMTSPMFLDGKFFGVISLGHSQPGAFTGAHLQLLAALADAVAAAVRSIQGWLGAQALALTNERNRIAQEIHDGVAQDLAFLAVRAESGAKMPAQAAATLTDMRSYLLRDIDELRRAINALQPVDVEKLGLELALRRLVTAFGTRHGLQASLETETPLPNLEHGTETAIFHTAQEALANVAKHAQAHSVQLRLEHSDREGLLLEVADDGLGFSEHALTGPSDEGGLGLERMRERVEILGGSMDIRSAPGKGTTLHIRFPVPQ